MLFWSQTHVFTLTIGFLFVSWKVSKQLFVVFLSNCIPKEVLTSNLLCTGLLSYTGWFNAAPERFNHWAIWKQCGCGKVKFRKVNFRNLRNTSQETKMKKNKFNSNRSVIFKLLCWTMSPQKNNTNAWLLTTINEEFRLLLSFSCCSCSVKY